MKKIYATMAAAVCGTAMMMAAQSVAPTYITWERPAYFEAPTPVSLSELPTKAKISAAVAATGRTKANKVRKADGAGLAFDATNLEGAFVNLFISNSSSELAQEQNGNVSVTKEDDGTFTIYGLANWQPQSYWNPEVITVYNGITGCTIDDQTGELIVPLGQIVGNFTYAGESLELAIALITPSDEEGMVSVTLSGEYAMIQETDGTFWMAEETDGFGLVLIDTKDPENPKLDGIFDAQYNCELLEPNYACNYTFTPSTGAETDFEDVPVYAEFYNDVQTDPNTGQEIEYEALSFTSPFNLLIGNGYLAKDIVVVDAKMAEAINTVVGSEYEAPTQVNPNGKIYEWTLSTYIDVFGDDARKSYVREYGVFNIENRDKFIFGIEGFKVDLSSGEDNVTLGAAVTRPAEQQGYVYAVNVNFPVFTKVASRQHGQGGVEKISASDVQANGTAVYYNLQGVRVDNPANGLYIMRQGNKATKVLVK